MGARKEGRVRVTPRLLWLSILASGERTMHIYFAARYSRRLEMRGYAQELENLGHSIASQWIDTGDNQQDDHDFELSERCGFAKQDWDDLRTANCMICFTEAPKTASRGGRHVEYGMALATARELSWWGTVRRFFIACQRWNFSKPGIRHLRRYKSLQSEHGLFTVRHTL